MTRCQYVSGLFLQCNNYLNPTPSTPSSSKQTITSTVSDTSSVYCDKHNAFIDTVKARANVTRSALDPDFKVPAHLSETDDYLSSTQKAAPSHVFEPSVSAAWAFDDNNPLRNAEYITDKEALRQYESSIDRMLDKVEDCRKLIYYRFVEHLKARPKVFDEKPNKRKHKLVVKSKEDQARVERLKADMSYGRYNRGSAAFLDKCYRKHKLEMDERREPDIGTPWKSREHIRDWLETPQQRDGYRRCAQIEKVNNSEPNRINYVSPVMADDATAEQSAAAVLGAVCECVVNRADDTFVERQCGANRIPMTDYCINHIPNDKASRIHATCKECGAACLAMDNGLCRKHARTSFVPLPPVPQPMPIPRDRAHNTLSTTTTPTTTRPSMRMPNVRGGINSWSMAGRMSHANIHSNGAATSTASMAHERADIKPSLMMSSGAQFVRRPRVPNRPLAEDERLPDGMYLVNQGDGSKSQQAPTVHTIDEDQPMEEFKKACELQKECLSNYNEFPLNGMAAAPVPPQTLRVNGYGGVFTRSPVAVIHSGANVDAVNRTKLMWGQQAMPRPNGTTTLPPQAGSARTRPFVGHKDVPRPTDDTPPNVPMSSNGKLTYSNSRKSLVGPQQQHKVVAVRRAPYQQVPHPAYIRQAAMGGGNMFASGSVPPGARLLQMRRVTPHR